MSEEEKREQTPEQSTTELSKESPAPAVSRPPMSRGARIAIIILAGAVVILLAILITWKLGDNSSSGGNSAKTGSGSEEAVSEGTTSAGKVSGETTEASSEEKAEKKTEEKTEEKTESKSEEKTEETTERKADGGKKTMTRPAVYATATAGSSWPSGDGFVVQYSVDVHNMKEKPVKDWEVHISGFSGAELGEHWSSEIEIKGDELTAEAVDYNTSIEAKSSTNFGFQVTFADEDAAKKVDLEHAEVYLDGKKTDETVEIPTAADIEKKRVVESEDGTPFEVHGALSVKDTDLVDKNGKLYQLKGVSTHGLAWFPQYVNEEAFRTFRDKWGANLIRLALYTDEGGGYCTDGDKAELKKLVDSGVEYATKLGMYVIIDWHILHDLSPKKYEDEAIAFFDEMSKKYADYGNVLYEICNEPNGGTDWKDIREYAEDVIPVIRKNSPDAVIIVGTPTWSQDVDKAAADPLEEYSNIMYTLHFYAATHKDNLRKKLEDAREDGLPIFISEFSICDASGNGGIDYESANEWFQLIEDYGLSYAAWNISNKAETSALIRSDCEKTSDWSDAELSETGLWLKNTMQE